MTATSTLGTARQMVLMMLRDTPTPTREQIQSKVRMVVQLYQLQGDVLDEELLVHEVEAACDVWIPSAVTMEDPRGHQEWLPERKGEIEWRFWDRYRRLLEEIEEFAPQSIRRLDDITNEIVRLFEDPSRPGAWDRRGLVVGQVQLGKTANYTGVICKAIDAGYRLIIVLAGSHNSLRSQTQLRLDQGVLGYDTKQRMSFDQSNTRTGVGNLPGVALFSAHTLTNASDGGDFRLLVARQAHIVPGGADPVLLVVKKNPSILKNLIKWATLIRQQRDPESGRTQVRGVPLLIIDDEADNASVDTARLVDRAGNAIEDREPSRINGLIRQLLNSFEQSVYLGYTATPFANIYIAPDAETTTHGEDLFPRSFIINLPAPSNYMGPARVFGLEGDETLGTDGQGELPIIREVDDQEDWIPDRHKNGHQPGPLPASLKRALRSFILACAIRTWRGQGGEHSSMLIHVTRFVSVQRAVISQIRNELAVLQRRLEIGDGNSPEQILYELRELWLTDFCPTTAAFPALTGEAPRQPEWEELADILPDAAARIEVREINGTAQDVLAYDEYPDGLHCIAVGGDKLSRGLTLSGLSVSYYLRASKMYDTLMQMGRWFGYRPGYADLCRLYTTDELTGWYRDITAASEELRQEFDQMAVLGETPAQYGLRVKSHPDGLLITAAAKMRNGVPMWISFSGSIAETVVFDRERAPLQANLKAVEELLQQLGRPLLRSDEGEDGASGGLMWRTGRYDLVLDFLASVTTHRDARKVDRDLLTRYIGERVADGELVEWVIGLAEGKGSGYELGGQSFKLVQRTPLNPASGSAAPYRIKRLVSPRDETIDLDDVEKARALKLTQDGWEKNPGRSRRQTPPETASGTAIRFVRPARRGLLLLYVLDPRDAETNGQPLVGFAISFPVSPDAPAIRYVVNNTYWQQEFGEE